MAKLQIVLSGSTTGDLLLPSALHDSQGRPRFQIPLGRDLFKNNEGNLSVDDGGLNNLVVHETKYNGYERPTRQFFEEHLAPGDVFIDVGAHWGIFSLSAATRWPGNIRVLAIEPHPQNILTLLRAVTANSLAGQIEVVAAAAGAEPGTAPIHFGSTMGHGLVVSYGVQHPSLLVSVVRLDDLVASRPALGQGRVFLKIDVEGYEYEVILGARKLLDSGRVAAIMWEKGSTYESEPGFSKMLRLMDELRSRGFTLVRFPSNDVGGPLIPFAPTLELCNVFALAPGFQRKDSYNQRFETRVPFCNQFVVPHDLEKRVVITRMLQEALTSDGIRWSNPAELTAGAEERAQVAARWIPPGASILDLGAGAMRLERHLLQSCRYEPADLVARSATCRVVDLNQGQFPAGRYDVVMLLEVLEYIHDVAGLLQRARGAASRLICSYHPYEPVATTNRRGQGWFNDYTRTQFAELLNQSGWTIADQAPLGDALFHCCQ